MRKLLSFSALGILMLLITAEVSLAADSPSLYVYLPTDIRPIAFQKQLQSHFPGVQVTVFGRIRDFQKNIKKKPPNAVLSPGPVVELQKGMTSAVQGIRAGRKDEKYVLLSIGGEVDAKTVGGKVIGILDLLGRKRMGAFVAKILNSSKAPKLKRVTRIEDLLRVLQFKLAQAILVSERNAKALQKASKLDLQIKPVTGMKVGLPVIAFVKGKESKEIVKAAQKLKGDINVTMGVERWNKL